MLIMVLKSPSCPTFCLPYTIDTNRQLIVNDNDLDLIIQQLEKPRLVLTAIPVLYNICADFGAFFYPVLNLSV